MNKPSLIKALLDAKLPQKVVRFVTHSKQAYISKVANNKLHESIQGCLDLDETEADRFSLIQKIYSLPHLPTEGITESDKQYIHLLKELMVDKDIVYETLYPSLRKTYFLKIWSDRNINFLDFDSTLIGIDRELYLDTFNID